jgi:glutaminyl-peptide cyclotransferase
MNREGGSEWCRRSLLSGKIGVSRQETGIALSPQGHSILRQVKIPFRIAEGAKRRRKLVTSPDNNKNTLLFLRCDNGQGPYGMKGIFSRLLVLLLLIACSPFLTGQASPKATPEYTFAVVRLFPHDPTAYTQGLTYRDGFLYEGTGRNGQSSLRKVRLETGEVIQHVDLGREFFGEGITIIKDRIFQLTWKSGVGFVYDLNSFHLLQKFAYAGEGWGLATDGRKLFLSDGTSEIRILNAETFQETRRIRVHDGATPVDQLNELELVEGQIFANVWHSNRIARISSQTGDVVGWIDLAGLLSPIYRLDPEAVLNGIAYDPIRKRLFVTGKLWPNIFEIRLSPKHSR